MRELKTILFGMVLAVGAALCFHTHQDFVGTITALASVVVLLTAALDDS